MSSHLKQLMRKSEIDANQFHRLSIIDVDDMCNRCLCDVIHRPDIELSPCRKDTVCIIDQTYQLALNQLNILHFGPRGQCITKLFVNLVQFEINHHEQEPVRSPAVKIIQQN